jgi:hypothetical protein
MNTHNFFHPSDRINQRSRLRRRSYPIHAYLGTGNGSGKSLMMIHDTLPSLEVGRPVLSTVRLLDYKNPRPCEDPTCTFTGHPNHLQAHPLWIPFKDYQQLLDAKDCDILFDEVTGIASSREYQSMPMQVANFLVQLRRRNVALRWSSTNWARSDIIIREVTQAATLSVPYFSRTRKSKKGEPPILWKDRFIFFTRTFDASLLDDFDARGADMGLLKPHALQLYFRKGAYAMTAYDTLDPVLSLGWANEAGMCMSCGGRRSIPKCSCSSKHHIEPPVNHPPLERVATNGGFNFKDYISKI